MHASKASIWRRVDKYHINRYPNRYQSRIFVILNWIESSLSNRISLESGELKHIKKKCMLIARNIGCHLLIVQRNKIKNESNTWTVQIGRLRFNLCYLIGIPIYDYFSLHQRLIFRAQFYTIFDILRWTSLFIHLRNLISINISFWYKIKDQ